ncbi:putative ribonuclease H-like domain-containing protein [Tanacetum coccineum]
MQEELLQFKLQKVWTLVDLPKGKHAIGTKSVYRNKKDERGIVVRNKARLVAQVYKVKKALYGLHQAPRAWYETLSTYLLENRFRRGIIDKTLFIKKNKGDILLVHVYVDDIIFGSIKKSLCNEFEKKMHKRFQISSMGVLTFFLGLQVKHKDDRIFISQDKYVADILKKFDFVIVKTTSTPIETNKALIKDEESKGVDVHLYRSTIGSFMYLKASRPGIMFAVCACARFQVTLKVSHLHAMKRIFRYLKGQPKLGLWYPRELPFDLEDFSNSDYARASLDRKSTTGGCQFLGKRQVLWIQNQMLDYGFNFMNTKIHIDNKSTICIVKNLVIHSKTKHIEIRNHFIRDSYEKRLIQVIKIHTDHNVADLLTKAFDVSRVSIRDEFGNKTGSCRLLVQTAKHIEYLVLNALPLKQAKRGQDTKIPQSGGPPEKVGDVAVHKELDDIIESAATTASSLEAEQDSGNINRTQSMATLNEPSPWETGSEQFWQTTTASTLENGDMEITTTIDGKVKIVSEASIRRHLKLEDSDGISTLPNTEIFEQLALMGSKKTAWEQFSSNIATAIICLATNRTSNFSKLIFDGMVKNLDKQTATLPHDSPLLRVHSLGSDEGNMTLHELTVLCTTLSKKVNSLESDLKQTKLTYGAAYTKLIKKVEKLEKTVKSSQARRRERVVVSDDEEELEDPSKQGRKIAKIDQDPSISLVQDEWTLWLQEDTKIRGRNSADTEILLDQEELTELVEDLGSGEKGKKEVSTASPEVKIVAESLVYIKRSAAKRKYKGKAVMKEAEPVQKKTRLQLEQERLGYKEALRLQEHLDEEERQRIVRVHEDASTFNTEEWDNIHAQIEADEELAQKLQAEERGKFSEAEKARLLVEMINERKRLFAQQRAKQRRNMLMNQAQQRTYMYNYIKHMGNFVPMESDDTVPKVVARSSKRDAEEELNQESSKRQKIGEGSEPDEELKDKESDELYQEQLQQLMLIQKLDDS